MVEVEVGIVLELMWGFICLSISVINGADCDADWIWWGLGESPVLFDGGVICFCDSQILG